MNDLQSWRRAVIGAVNAILPPEPNPVLPEEYQRVEWISPVADVTTNTKTNMICTGVMISPTIGYDVKYEVLPYTYNYNRTIIEALDTNGPCVRSEVIGSGNGSHAVNGARVCSANNPAIYAVTGQLDWGKTVRVIANVDTSGKVFANGQQIGSYGTFTIPSPQEITLFAKNKSTSCLQAYAKLYYACIYIAGVLVRCFIPCYRKCDGIIGMYDTATGAFYQNAMTGEWRKGEDIV